VQTNILGNDRLKEILINSEDKVLQNLRKYAQDSSECLLNKITEILDSLQLKCITTSGMIDNGSNIKEKLEQKYSIFKVHCFGYTLQLAINDALKVCDISTRWNSTFYLLKRLQFL
ncbi:13884_t:CDS:2, partial [Racocetra fulgida]